MSVIYGAVRYGISPYGINESLLGYKNIIAFKSDARISKTAKISEMPSEYKAYVIGSSRVRDGISPETIERITDLKTFNMGISGLLVSEMQTIISHLLEYSKPDLILVGLDFFAFNDSTDPSASMILKGGLTIEDHMRLYISSYGIMKSIEAISNEKKADKIFCYRNGYCKDKRFNPDQVAYYIEKGLGNIGEKGSVYFNFLSYQKSMNKFEEILSALKDTDTRVIFFITPAHYDTQKKFKEIGLKPLYDSWKLETIKKIQSQGYKVWDFDIRSAETNLPYKESYPFFNDDLHFTKEYGDKILEIILQPEGKNY